MKHSVFVSPAPHGNRVALGTRRGEQRSRDAHELRRRVVDRSSVDTRRP